jgi:GNAT superfamily N-acetyltransferase
MSADKRSGFVIVPLDSYGARFYQDMTFPAYRPLLLGPQAERIALALTADGAPAGLALAEKADLEAVVQSLYVLAPERRQGHATALLAALEDAAREAGCGKVSAIWMGDQPFTAAVERIVLKRNWEAPHVRMHVIHSDLQSIDRARWMTNVQLEPGYEIFPWTDLSTDERAALERWQAQHKIPEWVWPFASSAEVEPHSSLGVRYQGEVVGWVVNHPYDSGKVRFTCSYMREELQGRGRLIAAYVESINRCRAAGITQAVWTVPMLFPRMVAFARRHLIPYATSHTETRGSSKNLAAT